MQTAQIYMHLLPQVSTLSAAATTLKTTISLVIVATTLTFALVSLSVLHVRGTHGQSCPHSG